MDCSFFEEAFTAKCLDQIIPHHNKDEAELSRLTNNICMMKKFILNNLYNNVYFQYKFDGSVIH